MRYKLENFSEIDQKALRVGYEAEMSWAWIDVSMPDDPFLIAMGSSSMRIASTEHFNVLVIEIGAIEGVMEDGHEGE